MAMSESSRGMGGHQSHAAGKDEWLTPPGLLQQLGPFDLDPCAPICRPWDTAARHFTVEDDGLVQPWEGRVFCNPPYGEHTGKWLAKLARHGRGLALIFARTETADWHTQVWPLASGILFLRGRLHFHHVDGRRATFNGGAPSALVAYGDHESRFLASLAGLGAYVGLGR